jgi:hypothetical protein
MPLASHPERSTIEKARFAEHASNNRDAITRVRRAADAEDDARGLKEIGASLATTVRQQSAVILTN